jgi:hypothetical protein
MPTPQQRIQQHGRPPIDFAAWAAESGRVVTRGEVIALLKMERNWHRAQRWHRRLWRWVTRRKA